MARAKKAQPAATLEVTSWPIAKVIPYERNARKIPAAAVAKVADSIREFGWRQPIVVDPAGVIIAGHTRLLAAQKLALAEVPVHVASGLSAAQVKAYRLMDNRSHEEAAWNFDLLATELADLKGLDFNLELTGFDDREMQQMLRTLGDDGTADEAPEAPVKPVTVPGDLWVLGQHRVLCGDSTSATDVERLLGGAEPFLMVTDPPYGVEYDPTWRESLGAIGQHGAGKARLRMTGKVANDDRADWGEAFALFPGSVAYVWSSDRMAVDSAIGIRAVGFEIRACIIWRKQHFVMSRGAYHSGHEPCWYAVRKGSSANWLGDRKQSTVWEVQNLNPMGGNTTEKATGHGTQKPVELMRRPILNHTERGAGVYDPFLGSGTTLIACEELGRTCYGLDIDPKYVDVIVQRWQTFTGQQAILEGSGATFAEMSNERIPKAA